MPTNVLLLRSPSEDGGPDKYEDAFRARGYHALSVPVLETVHENLDELAQVVQRGGSLPDMSAGASARYAGVIITSARACEAWRTVVQQLVEQGVGNAAPSRGWDTVPFYVVGSATASALCAIEAAFPESPYTPRDIRGGSESGTAEKLAHYIVSDVPQSGSRRLLYLTGDKNRDTLPRILGDGGLELESLQVYATQGSSRFEDDLRQALGEVSQYLSRLTDGANAVTSADRGETWWIVHFAPSAAKAVSPTLAQYFQIPGAEATESRARRNARVAAIGPTTSEFLRDQLHIEVAVVAGRPTPEALSEGIAAWDRECES
ncbi:tetrapyrrole biosynthesis, uroporphyrinogen III synthase [Pilatotrama ljubarskyi]|nr:tetrapyrrole biosynthesis, uroporphyrinogen III synthase [Pilatotrama ljubarskyi]